MSWSVFEDAGAGLRVELPCASPEKRSAEGNEGTIAFTATRVICASRGTTYTLEYWTNVKLAVLNRLSLERTMSAMVTNWLEEPKLDGYEPSNRRKVDGPTGWLAAEVRSTKGAALRVDRHYMLLPRYIVLTTRSPADAPQDAERFLGSLRVGELGALPGQGIEGMAERSIDIGSDRFSVTLPCRPVSTASEVGESPMGPLLHAEFQCHHPSANALFNGMVGRFQQPLAASMSDAAKHAKHVAIAKENAEGVCQGVLRAGLNCVIGATRDLGSGVEMTVKIEKQGDMRIVVDYPYVALIAVIGPTMRPLEIGSILTSLKLPSR